MGRIIRVLSAAGLVTITGALSPAVSAQYRGPGSPEFRPVSAILAGTINGVVSDERGGPLSGALVSALGATTAMAVTDANGRFSIQKLPAGDYTLRAHLAGFAASRRDNVRVGTAAPAHGSSRPPDPWGPHGSAPRRGRQRKRAARRRNARRS